MCRYFLFHDRLNTETIVPEPARAIMVTKPTEVSRLLYQFERDLSGLVGLGEHGGAILHHHVEFGEVG